MQTNKSRQGVLAAANANLAAAKTTLAAVREKLAAAKNLKIKWRQEQSELTCFSENPFSLQWKSLFTAAKVRDPDLLEHETLYIKGEVAAILREKKKGEERTAKDQF